MTERIFRYLREQQPETPVPGGRSRRGRAQLPPHARAAADGAHLLRREGQPGRADPVAPGDGRLQVRHRLARRDRAGAGRRRRVPTASPSATRSRRKRTSPGPTSRACACSPSTARRSCRSSSASAPGAQVFCRVLVDCGGAEWPLSKKFGCAPEMAKDLLRKAKDWGLDPYGISFHVGSQQTDLEQWDRALGAGLADVLRARRSRASTCAWSTWAAASRRAIAPRSTASRPTARR